MNKMLLLLVLFCLVVPGVNGQNVGIGTLSPDPSASLHIVGDGKGLLIPRMNAATRINIVSPANGLLVYDLDSSSLFIFQQSIWKRVRAISSLADIITGNNTGEILMWNGSSWTVTSPSSIYTYVFRDGHGDKYKPVAGVLPFPGFVTDSIDCNDSDPLRYLGSPEICDGLDNDCDGFIDEGSLNVSDLPDDTFTDQNGDGIDGNICDAIFVAAGSSSANPGTILQPVPTIALGITRALAAGKKQIYVSSGTYNESVLLSNGISLLVLLFQVQVSQFKELIL